MLAQHAGRWICVPGGNTRTESVLAGVEALLDRPNTSGDLLVAVHDAARPLLSRQTLSSALAMAAEKGSAVCAEPLSDTIHHAGADGALHKTMNRAGWWRMQTPQIFPLADLRGVLVSESVNTEDCTDEAGAFLRAGRRVFLSPNADPNWKITTPGDLALARAWLRAMPRTSAEEVCL